MHEVPAGAQARSLRGGDTKSESVLENFFLVGVGESFSQLLLQVPLPLRLLV